MSHIHEKIDFTVAVYIVEGDAVLLRKHDKYDLWLVPGGHIELDENPNEAAYREVREETGLTVELVGDIPDITEESEYTELVPPRFMNIHRIGDTEHFHNDLVYFARASTRELRPDPGEQQDGLLWLTKSELESDTERFRETIRHYALAALKEVP